MRRRVTSFAGPDLVERYLKAREVSGIRPNTLRLQRVFLGAFVAWLFARGVKDLRRAAPENLLAYQRHLAAYRYRRSKAEQAPWKALAQRSRYDAMATVCRLFRWLVSERILIADPSGPIELGKRKHFQPAGVLTEEEARRLLKAPDPRTLVGLRDRGLLELLYSSGLRRAEATALDVTDIDLTGGTVLVRSGKGGKDRFVPLGETAANALRLYVEKVRPEFVRKPGLLALFLAATRCGSTGNRLSAAAIKDRIALHARNAGIERTVTPHALRHSLATHLLRAGADLRHVQAILGHARIDTTEAYTHLVAQDLARVHARCHPRGHGPRMIR
jgi:integrase/recombinase XerD